jgi:hypothetical protein
MAPSASGSKSRWLISAAAAALGLALLLALFRVPTAAPSPSRRSGPPIILKPGRTDELALRDLTPLFLPTPYNAAPSELTQPQPGSSYFDRDAVKLKFSDADPGLQLPAPFHAPAAPIDALAHSPGPLAAGIGRTNAAITPLPTRGAYVEVFAAATGESVLAQALGVNARPTEAGHEVQGWKPMEFIASVDPVGLVGPVWVTSSSGVEDVDNFFRNYLARTFRLGDRLTPGFYRIVVGP